MPNYNMIHTAQEVVPCTKEEFNIAFNLLIDPGLEVDQDRRSEIECNGFSLEYLEKGAYLWAEETGVVDGLPESFLKYFGNLIQNAGMPYLSIGYAETCGKMAPDSHNGGAWRIYPDGETVFSIPLWPRCEKQHVYNGFQPDNCAECGAPKY